MEEVQKTGACSAGPEPWRQAAWQDRKSSEPPPPCGSPFCVTRRAPYQGPWDPRRSSHFGQLRPGPRSILLETVQETIKTDASPALGQKTTLETRGSSAHYPGKQALPGRPANACPCAKCTGAETMGATWERRPHPGSTNQTGQCHSAGVAPPGVRQEQPREAGPPFLQNQCPC